MRTEKSHVSRSSSHTHSRLAFLGAEMEGCFLDAVLMRPVGLFGQADHGEPFLALDSPEQCLGKISMTITVDRNLSYFFIPFCHTGKTPLSVLFGTVTRT